MYGNVEYLHSGWIIEGELELRVEGRVEGRVEEQNKGWKICREQLFI